MRILMALAVLLTPAMLFAQDTYTNGDLTRFHVPGAYTNDDLKKLPAEAAPRTKPGVTPAPAAFAMPEADTRRLQDAYDGLVAVRVRLAADLEVERQRIGFSESAFAGATSVVAPRLGYRARVAELVLELEKRIAVIDAEIDFILETARRNRVAIEQWSR
jgi:hypothetical protein